MKVVEIDRLACASRPSVAPGEASGNDRAPRSATRRCRTAHRPGAYERYGVVWWPRPKQVSSLDQPLHPVYSMDRFERAVGAILRRARRARGYTLDQAAAASRGRFKPSALGGYERGERAISLPRFWELATLYRVPADRLLAEVAAELEPSTHDEVVIDLSRLADIPPSNAKVVAEFVHEVMRLRGDHLTNVITLRSGDVESLALLAQRNPRSLLESLAPAILG